MTGHGRKHIFFKETYAESLIYYDYYQMVHFPSNEKPLKQKSFYNVSKSTLPLEHLSNSLERDTFTSVAGSFRLKDLLAFVFCFLLNIVLGFKHLFGDLSSIESDILRYDNFIYNYSP